MYCLSCYSKFMSLSVKPIQMQLYTVVVTVLLFVWCQFLVLVSLLHAVLISEQFIEKNVLFPPKNHIFFENLKRGSIIICTVKRYLFHLSYVLALV